MQISAIWAEALNGGIGLKNSLPWPKLKTDMEWFRKHTLGKVVVMGWKTFQSLQCSPLKGRDNVIIIREQPGSIPHLSTHNGHVVNGAVYWVESVEKFFEARPDNWDGKEIMVMGGAKTYQQFCGSIERVYRTIVKQPYVSDTYIDTDQTTLEEWDMVFHDEFTDKEVAFQILELSEHTEPLAGLKVVHE